MNLTRAMFMALSVGSFAAMLSGCSGNAMTRRVREERVVVRDVSEAVALMTGTFTSYEQSKRDPEYREIQLHMTPIWVDRSTDNVKWLYVEQAAAGALDKPYRQRIYRVTSGSLPAMVVSEVYELPGGAPGVARYAGMWRTPQAFDLLNPSQLTRKDGCEVHLRRIRTSVFEGGTEGSMCQSTLQGATYATSQVLMNKDGLETWDRGFDAEGKQVWGAVKGPYEFRRISE